MPINIRPGILLLRVVFQVVWIFIFVHLASNSNYAQEAGKKEVTDTLDKKTPINQSLLRSIHSDVILHSSLHESQFYSAGFLHESHTNLPSSLSSQFQQQIDVVSPWKQELAKQNELRTLKLILGAVQVGATAYLLYEHISKYGLK
jgi:hypothetical protein